MNIIRLGRLTAFQKPTGGVRGIVAGEVLRRLVARTMAQQLGPAVETFTAPFQFALTTRSGCECVAHTIQTLCQADPELTLTSLDGVSAFDLISRRTMLEGLAHVSGGASALPFVHLFYGRPSRYLWEDDHGVVHAIEQGEGGEQGDPFMPLLFAVGQHAGLVATQERMQGNERLFAFLDDIYTLTSPSRVAPVHPVVTEELGRHAHISINERKTHVWNMGEGCAELQQVAEVADPTARVWRGAGVAEEEQGVRVLGAPVGHPSNVRAQLSEIQHDHQTLLDRIPSLPDLQSSWLLLLHCASARANYYLRVVPPVLAEEFAREHDQSLWRCLCRILGIGEGECQDSARSAATLPLALGGLGLRSALRTRSSASWADCLPLVFKRYPDVVADFVDQLEGVPEAEHLRCANLAARSLDGVQGFEIPSWRALMEGAASASRSRTPRTGKSEARMAARGVVSN